MVDHGPRDLEAVKAALLPHIDAYERRLTAAVFEEPADEIPMKP